MNPLPPNADELVSAYLDGQAAPDEIIIVESSPELMKRVQSLRDVADLVGQSVTPPAAQKEAHLSAALDAFDALFSAEAADTTPLAAVQPITPAPPTAVPSAPSVDAAATEAKTPPGVTSLAAARERRRPRFNPGVIAAAAVVLLFVALAAFGLGSGEDSFDVASTEVAGDASSDTTSVEAMDEEEAMDDAESPSALSGIAPSPTAAAAPQAAAADSVDDAMDDEEEAMDDEEAMSDSIAESAAEAPEADFDDESSNEAGAAATESLDAEPFRLFAGEFADQDELLLELKQLPVDEIAERVPPLEPGLFDSCQPDVSILSDIATPTIIGDALIAGDLIEIHQIGEGDDLVIILVDPTDCSIVPQTP